jgi:hypothetical protein
VRRFTLRLHDVDDTLRRPFHYQEQDADLYSVNVILFDELCQLIETVVENLKILPRLALSERHHQIQCTAGCHDSEFIPSNGIIALASMNCHKINLLPRPSDTAQFAMSNDYFNDCSARDRKCKTRL